MIDRRRGPGRRAGQWLIALAMICGTAAMLRAQDRIAVLEAEDRRAPTARDLAIIQRGLHSRDPQTVRVAVRALGRLERPALSAEIQPLLHHVLPEIRAEAANALAQAAQGLKRQPPRTSAVRTTSARRTPASPLETIVDALAARVKVESDSTVLGAVSESLGRLPFTTVSDVDDAAALLLEARSRDESADARVGVAQGFEALTRTSRKIGPLPDAALEALAAMAALQPRESTGASRIRRLSLEALINAGAVQPATLTNAFVDPDFQVRRLAMKAAGTGDFDAVARSVVMAGLVDPVANVRYEALRVIGTHADDGGCAAAQEMTADHETHVALLAIDTLASCGWSSAAVAALDAAAEFSGAGATRAWHRAAHAIVALAAVAPDRASTRMAAAAGATTWQIRMYAAHAAAVLKNRQLLERLAVDANDNVRDAAVDGLAKTAGHDADDVFIAELTRDDNQLIRDAAAALKGSPRGDRAVPALQAALQRLKATGRDNARDAEAALIDALQDLGAAAEPLKPVAELETKAQITVDDIRRLQGARARVTIKGVGAFDLALIATEAPATVIRFASLAEAGYYNGLTFHRVVPNFVIQGGSPGANEYAGDAAYMRDELGLWPHVRGAVGISTRGRDTGDAQIFVDLVDNPRLDHEFTVFAQVLNGIEIVDAILEGDVIESITLLR